MRKLAIFAALPVALCASPAMAQFACDPVHGTALSPYSEAKFQSVLSKSKLQLPDSSTCITKGNLTNFYYDPDNWYLDNSNMQFEIDNGAASQRNELRGDSFAGTRTNMRYRARFKIRHNTSDSDRFTVAQIYGQTGGVPILRIEYQAYRAGLSDRLWGIYRVNPTASSPFEYQDLGPAPFSFTQLDLVYNDGGTITAKLGSNATRTWSTNFGFYNQSSKQVYFKSGCYLQDAGDCYVRFSTLNFET